jgi:NAD(P)-dependent dehydrogenase (short-subunit alcohol dehydrogenase family)
MASPAEMRGKVYLVTGANSGIGKATAQGLARRGATVVMVCRDEQRGRAAREEIVERSGNPWVDLLLADLASQAAVRHLAEEFKAKYSRLHVLINNAGLNLSQRSVTADGIETTFAVNYLAPFLLTQLLLDRLMAGAPARVINLGTWIQPPIDLDDVMREKRYDPMETYTQSKTALVMFTRELAKRLNGTGVTVNCVNPGLIRTNLGSDSQAGFRLSLRLFLALMRPFMKSPEQAAQTLIFLAASPEVEAVSGKFFTGQKVTHTSKEPYEDAMAERLWRMSEQLAHLPATVQ